MLRIVMDVDRPVGQAIGIKEALAMDLERYGDVRVVSVEEITPWKQEVIERTEELVLAMNAGARAIEHTWRYYGAVYTRDVFSESPQEIPYLQAAKVLREVSDAPAADVAPVVHGEWIEDHDYLKCPECGVMVKWDFTFFDIGNWNYCPNCGAKMDGGDNNEAD